MTAELLPVILCGGSGTRLFPLSRERHPKQFLRLTGPQTMLQQTAMRLRGWEEGIPLAPMSTLVCHEEHRFLAASQWAEAEGGAVSIILEPAGRNTAPALTLAALHACRDGADPVMLVMPADHVIQDIPAFQDAVRAGFQGSIQGEVVTFGVLPQYPETGFGYIQYRQEHSEGNVFAVEAFTEKPGLALAQHYVQQQNFLWNSGIFMLRTSTWLKALQICNLEILGRCQSAMRSARHDLDFIRPDKAAFTACPSDSIDYAVMEKLLAHPEWGIACSVVPLNAGWSDVGSWDALWKVTEQDNHGNAVIGDAVLHQDCNDTLFMSNSRLVAGVGLHDLIVVETADAVLVADKRCTQEVKTLVNRLSEGGHRITNQHRKVHRPWGWYDLIDSGERFQVKRIVVNPGASLSLQMHQHRAEHWVVVKGEAEVTHGESIFSLKENESTYIPPGHKHRLRNATAQPLEIIEVQSGSYLGEDDIVRFDDAYGRAKLPVSSYG